MPHEFLKANFPSITLLVFAVLVAVTIAWVLLGATKLAIVNTLLITVTFPVTTIYVSL